MNYQLRSAQPAISIVFAIALCSFCHLYGQVNYYTFSQSSTSYIPITGGVVLGNNVNNGYGVFLDPDTTGMGFEPRGPGLDIGFDFHYRGITYDRFGVANNGWIFLGKSIYDSLGVDIGSSIYQQPMTDVGPENVTLRSRIVGFNFWLSGNEINSTLRYERIGDSPDRILVIQWKDYAIYSPDIFPNSLMNFQIRLYESDDAIEIKYGQCSFDGITGFAAQVGLSGLSLLEFNNRTTMSANDWNSTILGTSFNDGCTVDMSVVIPEDGLTFRYDPASCVPPTSIELYQFSASSLSFSWQTPYTNPAEGYEYFLSESSSPPASGILINSDSITITSLNPGTQYYFHIRSRCDTDLFSDWFTIPATTLCDPYTLPYVENFDDVMAPDLPDCIRTINIDPVSYALMTTTDTYSSSPNSFGYQCNNYDPEDDWVFTPGFILQQDSTYIISLEFLGGDSMFVYSGNYPLISNMTVRDTFLFTYDYTSRYTLFTSPATDTIYFGLHVKNCGTRLDDLTIKKYDCKVPQDIAITKNTGDSVIVSWTAPSPAPMEYEYQLTDYLQFPPSTLSTTSDDSILFTGLLPSRDYYLFIRSSCGGGEYSPWTLIRITTVPFNDECTNAIELIPDPGFNCTLNRYSTVGATDSGISPGSCGGIPDDDVWFRFEAIERSHRIFVKPYSFESRPGSRTPQEGEAYTVELYADSCGGSFLDCVNIVGYGASGEIIRTNLVIGNTYYVRVFGTDAYNGGSDFDICIGAIPIESNDNCANAQLLVSSGPVCDNYVIANLAGTTPSTTPSSSCPGAPYYDIWYKFAAIDTTQIIEAHFLNGGDGVMQVFTGECDDLTDIGCSHDTIPGSEIMILNNLVIGDTIFIRMFDSAGVGSYIGTEICVRIPHPNDECTGATEITTVSGVTMHDPANDNTTSATGDGQCDGNYADDDLWYKFIAAADTQLIVVISTGYPEYLYTPVIELFSDNCQGTSMGCSATGDMLAVGLIPGQEYYFRIYSAENGFGQGNFSVCVTIPPPNYTCSAADSIAVNVGTSCEQTTIGTLVGAGINNEVWYKFVAPDSTVFAKLDYISGAGSFLLSYYEDCNGPELAFGGYNSFYQVYYQHFIPGHSYYLKVWAPAYNGFYNQGTFSLCLIHRVNDECAGAITIPANVVCTVPIEGESTGATPSNVQDTCIGIGSDVWYKFTALSTFQEITFSASTGSLNPEGQIYAGSCAGPIIQCFSYNIYSPYITKVYLPNLTIGETYFIRLKIAFFYTGTYDICITSPPPNDDCSQAIFLEQPLTTKCNPLSSASGTTINATYSIGDSPDVWYGFIAKTKSVAIHVTPSTPGFDPMIKLWTRTSDGGIGDQSCVVEPVLKTTDITHSNGQPEVMIYFGLTPDAYYLIEIMGGTEATAPGNFDICISTLNSAMKVHSAEYSTYDMDSTATAGKWEQPVVKITLRMSGTTNNQHIEKVVVNTSGTTDVSDIKNARLYIDPKIAGINILTFPFKPFGEPGIGIANGYPAPVQFGQTIPNPDGTLTFTGNYTMPGDLNTNYNRYLYLVYDIKCDATLGHVVNGQCTSITIDDEVYHPYQMANAGLPIADQLFYDTQNDGDWNNGNTWVCNVPPPDGPDIMPIYINHQVTVSDTQQCSNLKINYLRSLTLNPGTEFTLGASSMGNASGYSNKYFDCKWGSLSLDSAILNVNGSIMIGEGTDPTIGSFHAMNSTLNQDGVDGTSNALGGFVNIGTTNFVDSAFNITILDPATFIFWGSSYFGTPLHGTLTFGGGDDTPPGATTGYYISWGPYSFLRPDSLIIAGGYASDHREVNGVAYGHHIKVMNGAEFVGTTILNGNLINNGLMTIPTEISFCGDADIANYYTNTTNSQSLSGNGFFRSDINNSIPSNQTENRITKLQVANTYSGLDLEMPLGIKQILRIRKGKINNSISSLLTLGDSIQPGILVTVPQPPYQDDPNKFYETSFTGGIGNWDGGYVHGPLKIWFQDTTPGKQIILPIGGDSVQHPVSIAFMSADSGFITAQFMDGNPGTDGLPLISEQGVDLNNVSTTGYWHVSSSNLTDPYDLAVNANGFTVDEDSVITDVSNVRLIKRPDNGAWDYSGSPNTSPPVTLDSIGLPGITGFSDFAIGTDCNLIVTNANDSGAGSLRYIIQNCAQPNDTIKFASNMDLLYITSDTIVLDKNIYLFNNHPGQIILQTSGPQSTFKINTGVQAGMKNLLILSGSGLNGRAIWNDGVLTLKDVIVVDNLPGGNAIYNKGTLFLSGTTEIRNQ